jgi:putative Ig domain-containing protein
MKTISTYFVMMLILLVLVAQSVPIKARTSTSAGMAYALPEARVGANYEFTIKPEEGHPPFKWSILEGDLPPGIELKPSGILRGTPTVPRPRAYEFTLKVSDSSEPPRTHIQRFAMVVTTAALPAEGRRQPFSGKDQWKNRYIQHSEEIASLKGKTTKGQGPSTATFASESDQPRSKTQVDTASSASSPVLEFDEQSFARARDQHKVEKSFVNEFVKEYVTVLDPKSVSDIFGRRIAKRYVAFQVTISNENKDYQFLIQDVSIDLGEVADLESVRIPKGYTPSSNDLSMLRGVSEKGQVYDWRNFAVRLMRGTGSIATSLAGVTTFGSSYVPSVSVWNGALGPAFRDVLPDLTVTQLHRLNDSAYQANTLVPKQGAKVMVAFVDQAMLMDRDLQKRFYKDPMSIADIMDFRNAKARVRGMLITDVLDLPPLISAVVIGEDQRAHYTDSPATIEGTVVGRNLAGAGIQIDNKGMEIRLKGTPESTRLTFILTAKEPILPDSVLNFVVVRKDDVAKQPFPVSYTIPVPTLDTIAPEKLKQGDADKEVKLTGDSFVKSLLKVTGCDAIKIKDPVWQSATEIKIKVDIPDDAATGSCKIQVKNGDNLVSAAKPLTIEAKSK